jgi:hypothetical protein
VTEAAELLSDRIDQRDVAVAVAGRDRRARSRRSDRSATAALKRWLVSDQSRMSSCWLSRMSCPCRS